MMHADQGGCMRTIHAFHFYLDFRGATSVNTCHNDSVGSDSPQNTSTQLASMFVKKSFNNSKDSAGKIRTLRLRRCSAEESNRNKEGLDHTAK